MKNNKSFSLQARFKSFVYAATGVQFFFREEPQALIHLLATIVVLVAGNLYGITYIEWMLVVFSIGLVLVAEILNTAIEKLTDMVSPEIHPKAKVVKDLAAGAVLMASLVALVIGLIIFIPRIF